MIGYLKGKVFKVLENSILFDVNNVGYELNVSINTMSLISNIKDEIRIYTYLNVTQDGIVMYGFATEAEKELFLKLTTVSGIGPKMAIGILSSASVENITVAITSADAKTIATYKGVGKKTAARIIIELKDKFKAEDIFSHESTSEKQLSSEEDDAITALTTLGYSKTEAYNAVRAIDTKGLKVEQILGQALKGMK